MNQPKVVEIGSFHEVTGVRIFTNRIAIGSTEGVTRVLDISRALHQPFQFEGAFGTVDFHLPETRVEGLWMNRVSHILIVPDTDVSPTFHTHRMLIRTEVLGNFLWTLFSPGKAPWLPN